MKSQTILFVAALTAALAFLSLGGATEARAEGFAIDPQCTKIRFRDPARDQITCTCYLQNGGWIGARWGQRVVFGPPNPQLIDVINNCIMAARPAPAK